MRIPVFVVTVMDYVTTWLYQKSDGRLGGHQGPFTMLMLQTVGRKSGQVRNHTLLYTKEGPDFIVIGSNVGQEHHPAWYLNLRTNPRAKIQAHRRHYEVLARFAEGEEYERLWEKLNKVYPYYSEYKTHTKRTFPIVVLQPLTE